MRTTFEIDETLIKEVMETSKAKTKKGAIVIALKEYIKNKKRQELKAMIGKYDELNLSLIDLKKMREDG